MIFINKSRCSLKIHDSESMIVVPYFSFINQNPLAVTKLKWVYNIKIVTGELKKIFCLRTRNRLINYYWKTNLVISKYTSFKPILNNLQAEIALFQLLRY